MSGSGRQPGANATALILAAGYGTRMGVLGRHRPKALLPIGGLPILDRLVDRIAKLDRVERLHLVTNHRFAEQLLEWKRKRSLPFPVEVIDDGTGAPDERLGAIGDLALTVQRTGPDGPVLVAGSDNVFDFSFQGLADAFTGRPDADAVITVVPEVDRERLRSSGVPELDPDGRVVRFQEKPEDPSENLLAPPLYLFSAEGLRTVGNYLARGGNPDAPGHFLSWLVEHRSVYAWRAPGSRHDIGTPERYAETRRCFEESGNRR